MTDVLGFAGIADVLPEEFKFDWGSFLGGSVGGGVAVGLFLLQRGIDRRENEKRRLSFLRGFCLRAIINIEGAIGGGKKDVYSKVAVSNNYFGFAGKIQLTREQYEKWENLTDAEKSYARAVAEDGVEFVESQFVRLLPAFEKIVVDADAPKSVVEKWFEILVSVERIMRMLQALKMDYSEQRWSVLTWGAARDSLQSLWDLDDDLKALRGMLINLKSLCENY
jgi:hypothetical protein